MGIFKLQFHAHEIFKKPVEINRQDLISQGKKNDNEADNVKDNNDESKKQQFYDMINKME